MSYFAPFNYVLYPNFITQTKDPVILKNITSRVVRKISPVDDKSIFYTYTMLEGERPEDVSYKLYGNVNYYWTILLANERFDYNYDFPLTSKQLNEMIIEKYGSTTNAYNTPVYWIRLDKSKVNEDAEENFTKDRKDNFIIVPENFSVEEVDYTFSTYPTYSDGVLMKYSQDSYAREVEQNEDKRTILVLEKNYVSFFVNEFNNLISQ